MSATDAAPGEGFEDLTLDLEYIRGGGSHYNYFRTTDEGAETLYAHMKRCWAERENTGGDKLTRLLEDYRRSNFHPNWRHVRDTLDRLYRERADGGPFSFIDFGGANGSIFHVLADTYPAETLRYALVDPYPPFVEDFLAHHPDQTAIVADAETFATLPDTDFGQVPFDVFYASHVLYLMAPSAARAVLARAARLADTFVIADHLMNFHGQMSKTDPVIFDFRPELRQFYFSHHHTAYLQEIGFEVTSRKKAPTAKDDKKGFGVFVARRTSNSRQV